MSARLLLLPAVVAAPTVALLPLTLAPRPTDLARLAAASQLVGERLYVSLEGDWDGATADCAMRRLQSVYETAAQWSSAGLDVRVLLPPADGSVSSAARLAELDAVLGPTSEAPQLLRQLNTERRSIGLHAVRFQELPEWPLPAATGGGDESGVDGGGAGPDARPWLGRHEALCVGGTFDRAPTAPQVIVSVGVLCSCVPMPYFYY